MIAAVTGACGHLGANLVRTLADAGQTVRAIDRRRTAALDGLDVEFNEVDVLDPKAMRSALAGVEIVYHLAGAISILGDPDGQVWRTNVEGVATVAAAALQNDVRRLIHVSSVHALDLERCASSVDETCPLALRSDLPSYDRSKAAGEVELARWQHRGLDTIILKPTAIIGPLDFGLSRMGKFFLALRDRKLHALVAGGFDWVDARDVAAALLACSRSSQIGRCYLVAGHRASLRHLARLATQVTGVPSPIVTLPMPVAGAVAWALDCVHNASLGHEAMFTSEGMRVLRLNPRVASEKASQDLGHRPRPLADTVGDIYAWLDLLCPRVNA